MKKLEKEEFLKFFSKKFYDKVLNESLVSFKRKMKKSDAKNVMYEAYEKLFNFDYFIGNPTEYIYLLKTSLLLV